MIIYLLENEKMIIQPSGRKTIKVYDGTPGVLSIGATKIRIEKGEHSAIPTLNDIALPIIVFTSDDGKKYNLTVACCQIKNGELVAKIDEMELIEARLKVDKLEHEIDELKESIRLINSKLKTNCLDYLFN